MTLSYNIYKKMPESQIFSESNKAEYRFLYDNLKNKKTFSYIDENKRINLITICKDENLMTILKAKKNIYVDKHNLGLSLKINILEYSFYYEFVYDVFNNYHREIIENMVTTDEDIIITFVVKQGLEYYKAFHFNFSIEEKLKERIDYIKNITYNMQYPRIDREDSIKSESNYFEVKFSLNVIEDIINICDKLSKWKSLDVFDLSIDYKENIIIMINGECRNINLIKLELTKKHALISEGKTTKIGVPLLRYNKGYLYFFKTKA